MRLTERVYMVGSGDNGFCLSDRADCNIYLIDGGDELALIDAGVGEGTDRILDNIRLHGFNPDKITTLFLTHIHADHAGGSAGLRSLISGLKVAVAGEAALALRQGDEKAISLDLAKKAGFYAQNYFFQPCPVDIELQDGDQITVGDLTLQAISAPGHSAYDMAYVVQVDQKTSLFSGDIVFHDGKILLQSTWDCDLQKLITSLRRLGEVRVDVLLPGHNLVTLKDGTLQIWKAIEILDHCLIPKSLL